MEATVQGFIKKHFKKHWKILNFEEKILKKLVKISGEQPLPTIRWRWKVWLSSHSIFLSVFKPKEKSKL